MVFHLKDLFCFTCYGEEHGLHGSRYYSENPLFPLANTVVDINIDMIGRRDSLNGHKENGKYVYVIGSDRLSSELHTINEAMNQKYVGLNLDYKYNDRKDPERIYFRSDHYNFAKKGCQLFFTLTELMKIITDQMIRLIKLNMIY